MANKKIIKPHPFCETPEEKCTMNYCDENGCMNRKRVLVEPTNLLKEEIRFQKITQDIFTEIKRQDDKWGEDRDNHPLVWLSILQEEFGELAREINDAEFKPHELSENYRTELIQIVAVGMQAIKNFDTFTVNLKTSH